MAVGHIFFGVAEAAVTRGVAVGHIFLGAAGAAMARGVAGCFITRCGRGGREAVCGGVPRFSLVRKGRR